MFKDKLKKIAKKTDEIDNEQKDTKIEDKKKIENLVFFVVILIITIVAINMIWNKNDKTTKQENTVNNKKLASITNQGEKNDTASNIKNDTSENIDIEKKLEEILSKIDGVGEVRVFINYSESSEVVAMYNENSKTSNTEENDTSGGIRKIQETDTQKEIIYKEDDGEKVPITKKVIQPKVEGAIITAKGANNATTKTNIVQAVEAVTGLATHKIQVFEMN